MNQKSMFCALVLVATTLFSCSKDDVEENNTTGATNLLTRSGWKPVKSEYTNAAGAWINSTLQACEKDDVLKFNTNNKVTQTVNTKCNTEVDETFTWSLSADGKILTIVDGADTQTITIDVLDESTLAFSISEVENGVTYKYKSTYGH